MFSLCMTSPSQEYVSSLARGSGDLAIPISPKIWRSILYCIAYGVLVVLLNSRRMTLVLQSHHVWGLAGETSTELLTVY